MEGIVKVLQRIAGIGLLAAVVLGFGGFLIWAVGAALGLPFPLGVLVGAAILIVAFPVGAYTFYLALVVSYEWISGKPVNWR